MTPPKSQHPILNWHQRTAQETLHEQKTNLHEGLTHKEVEQRRTTFGSNRFEQAKRKSPWKILLSQFTDFLVIILFFAALIAILLGEPQDSFAILAIILVNGILGFTQEYRAEKAIEALHALASPQATVRRHGKVLTVQAFELVPGDIVLLESGNLIPADLRLVDSANLYINESTLTGESNPVSKTCDFLSQEDLPVADQQNMAFKGTLVTSGRATGVVVRTGLHTELGKIANLLHQEIEVNTPLQKKMTALAKNLALLVVALCAIIFSVGIARGEAPILMFLTALSLAVAAIPEALPAVISVTLGLGARIMSKKNALVRKLSSVEALGSVTYICTDKTGTLTENKMTVQKVWASGQKAEELLFQMLALSNDAMVGESGALYGDPTETALLAAAIKEGLNKSHLESLYPRIAEIPFSAERGMMSTLHQYEGKRILFTKGAPEQLLKKCINSLTLHGTQSLNIQTINSEVIKMAAQGYRVLAFAYGTSDRERDLTFLGLIGLRDPPRREAKEAIHQCRAAGIHPVMITGDHPETAKAIANKLNLLTDKRSELVTGSMISKMTDNELQQTVKNTSVYARVAPEQKLRIVKALQAENEIVAMTGDGVNDAPALKRADVGIAMGKSGTDVAREASHLILLDDNFATIVASVSEGRRIYDNIRKFVRFSLSGNSGELWTLFLAPFLGLPIPLIPIQILWINLITDGLPGLALAFEPNEFNHMQRPPRKPNESIFSRGLWQHCLWVGLLISGLTLSTLAYGYRTENPSWQSMAFTVLALSQMGHVLAIRSETQSIFSLGLRSNLYVLGTVLLTLTLQLMCLYVPVFRLILKTQPLKWQDLILCLGVSSIVFIAVEIEKWIRRKLHRP